MRISLANAARLDYSFCREWTLLPTRCTMRRAPRDRPATGRFPRCAGLSRPRLELLEDRLYPGDTLLGIWALGLWPASLASTNDSAASQATQIDGRWQHRRSDLEGADSLGAIFLLPESERAGGGSVDAPLAAVSTLGTAGGASAPFSVDDEFARQFVLQRTGASPLPWSPTVLADLVAIAAGPDTPWFGISET